MVETEGEGDEPPDKRAKKDDEKDDGKDEGDDRGGNQSWGSSDWSEPVPPWRQSSAASRRWKRKGGSSSQWARRAWAHSAAALPLSLCKPLLALCVFQQSLKWHEEWRWCRWVILERPLESEYLEPLGLLALSLGTL